ncbi:MAG: hypothetical protein WC254_05715 [Candidatus Woesearchaeota archaeon]|jgi:hypothetical protein
MKTTESPYKTSTTMAPPVDWYRLGITMPIGDYWRTSTSSYKPRRNYNGSNY